MNIAEICSNLLDNADVMLDFSNYPKVVLNFVVAGTVDSKYWEVQFKLESVFELSVLTDYDEMTEVNDSYLVLETAVKSEIIDDKEVHSIYLESGDFEFSAKTVGFNFSTTAYDRSELITKYPFFFG